MDDLSRRSFLAASAVPQAAQRIVGRPNVLFIMTDQQRFDCLGANGNNIVKTPNLDKLASQSANFTNTFVQAPVCVPSRVSYFTGRYPHCHKNRVNYTPCDAREVFLQRIFHDAGYQTGQVGKLHYYPPTADHARSTGWDHVQLDDGVEKTDPFSDYVHWKHANDPQKTVSYNAVARNTPAGTNPFRGIVEYQYSPTWWTGMRSSEMLKDFSTSTRPFFMFSSFFKPHSPHTIPEPFDAQYNKFEIPLPPRMALEDIRKLPMPLQRHILRGTPVYNMDRDRLQWIYRSYYGAISMVDEQVGKILHALDESGKADDTIVVFASDHGDQLLEHGLEGKNVFFESSIRVPLLIRWPRRFQPGKRADLTESIDLAPTLLELCGFPVPNNMQGRSLLRNDQPREMVFSENIIPEVITGGAVNFFYTKGKGVAGILHPDAKMVRTRKWKFNHYPGEGGELYDLVNDPEETRNLFIDPERKGIVSDLKGAILDWQITADESEQIAPKWLL